MTIRNEIFKNIHEKDFTKNIYEIFLKQFLCQNWLNLLLSSLLLLPVGVTNGTPRTLDPMIKIYEHFEPERSYKDTLHEILYLDLIRRLKYLA